MEFRLIYDGELPSNGNACQKHAIREAFHLQLQRLWQQIPLSAHASYLNCSPNAKEITVIRRVGDLCFASLVCESLHLFAEIDIVMLRPGPPGQIITQAGDIDNCLKTLFDALRCPQNANEIPAGWVPNSDQMPYFVYWKTTSSFPVFQ